MADLVDAAASELEAMRSGGGRAKHPRAASMSVSPPNVPPCEESSLSDTSDSETDQTPCTNSSSGAAQRGFCRSNTVAAPGADESRYQRGCPGRRFPPNCLGLLRTLPGNGRCVDCGDMNPEWASVSYGALLCLRCSGRHRGLGVNNSVVRSIAMDNWSHPQVLSMLEGGNDQLSGFFARHSLSPCANDSVSLFNPTSNPASAAEPKTVHIPQQPQPLVRSNSCGNVAEIVVKRYKTKAALFYRQNLAKHVERVAADGEYKGREVARKRASKSKATDSSSSTSPDRRRPRKEKASNSDNKLPPISADAI